MSHDEIAPRTKSGGTNGERRSERLLSKYLESKGKESKVKESKVKESKVSTFRII